MNYVQLTYEERYYIYQRLKMGESVKSIATQLRRSSSTIYREINRNTGKRGYRYKQAHTKALHRRKKRASMTVIPLCIWNIIAEKLRKQWSPEQISLWLKDQQLYPVSHERIYQYVIADKRAGGVLYKNLRRQRRYRKRGSGKAIRIINQRSIEDRPKIVDARKRYGDWEVDLVMGKGYSGALISAVERKGRLCVLSKVDSKNAKHVSDALIAMLSPYKVHTITSDNGREFARHQQIAKSLGADYFFAHPYASWERGTNENMNGLLRQYFPKGMDFRQITEKDIDFVMRRLNNRPRKVLNAKTPAQLSDKIATKSVALTS